MSQIAVKIKDRANWIFFGDLFSLNDSVSKYSFAVPFIPIRGPTAENHRAGAGVPRLRSRTGVRLALTDNAQRNETRRQHHRKTPFGISMENDRSFAYRVLARWLVETRPPGTSKKACLSLRELLGQLRPRAILTAWMAELERLAAARPHRAWSGPE
jgi:hypothetical protein